MKNIITNIDSRSPLAESIKTLRTNLQFMNPSEGMQSILVTSTLPNEGKSWVSSNLAVAFAQAGKRTVLIDSDLRKGTLHYLFDLPLTPGLSNYLSGVNFKRENLEENPLKYIIQRTEVKNLSVITAGDIPPNPSELILSRKMENLFVMLKEFADVVIFDGTPSLLVTDAVILSRMVNSTIIIAEYNKTKMNNLKQVKDDIEKVGGKIAGVVLNKVPEKEARYGYGYGYGYGANIQTVKKENSYDYVNKRTSRSKNRYSNNSKSSSHKRNSTTKREDMKYNNMSQRNHSKH